MVYWSPLLIAATELAQNREFKSATLRSHKMGAQEQDTVFWFTLNERSLTKSELQFKRKLVESRFWANGCTLNIHFLDKNNNNENNDRAAVIAKCLHDWEAHANITFKSVTDKCASHIRVNMISDDKVSSPGSSHVGRIIALSNCQPARWP